MCKIGGKQSVLRSIPRACFLLLLILHALLALAVAINKFQRFPSPSASFRVHIISLASSKEELYVGISISLSLFLFRARASAFSRFSLALARDVRGDLILTFTKKLNTISAPFSLFCVYTSFSQSKEFYNLV